MKVGLKPKTDDFDLLYHNGIATSLNPCPVSLARRWLLAVPPLWAPQLFVRFQLCSPPEPGAGLP